MNYREKLKELEAAYNKASAKKETLLVQKDKLEKQLEANTKILNDLRQEKEIVLSASSAAREQGRILIEGLATDTLKYALGDNISVSLESTLKRSVPVIDVVIKNTQGDISQPDLDAGGISDLIALSTFVATNSMSEDNKAPLFLDEPTKFVSADHHNDVSEFISKIPAYSNRQVFISTHDIYTPNTGKCFKMVKENETTTITQK